MGDKVTIKPNLPPRMKKEEKPESPLKRRLKKLWFALGILSALLLVAFVVYLAIK